MYIEAVRGGGCDPNGGPTPHLHHQSRPGPTSRGQNRPQFCSDLQPGLSLSLSLSGLKVQLKMEKLAKEIQISRVLNCSKVIQITIYLYVMCSLQITNKLYSMVYKDGTTFLYIISFPLPDRHIFWLLISKTFIGQSQIPCPQ